MALVLAVVSMPMLSGLVIADLHCVITTDICHPLQPIDASPASLFAPPSQMPRVAELPRDTRQTIKTFQIVKIDRLGETPDPPPPKALL